MEKGKSQATIYTKDRFGDDLTIQFSGIDRQHLAHFGGLDLHVTATKALISDIDGLSFPEKEGDYLIREKVAALYLNEIGQLLRESSMDSEMLKQLTNIEIVKDFINNLHPDVFNIIKKDNDLIRKDIEDAQREDDAAWSNIINERGKA
ncbi:hypothetical protein [Bacillus infantis]|uniref:hypothetical protein n=1 Tax=Bacillus infantis TaxID=324767 RepID=UPI0020A00A81|nr:hypothetical protein [Bacillus infantis]MCP1161307.1 hypothetical protein [Bacillus infantis]